MEFHFGQRPPRAFRASPEQAARLNATLAELGLPVATPRAPPAKRLRQVQRRLLDLAPGARPAFLLDYGRARLCPVRHEAYDDAPVGRLLFHIDTDPADPGASVRAVVAEMKRFAARARPDASALRWTLHESPPTARDPLARARAVQEAVRRAAPLTVRGDVATARFGGFDALLEHLEAVGLGQRLARAVKREEPEEDDEVQFVCERRGDEPMEVVDLDD